MLQEELSDAVSIIGGNCWSSRWRLGLVYRDLG